MNFLFGKSRHFLETMHTQHVCERCHNEVGIGGISTTHAPIKSRRVIRKQTKVGWRETDKGESTTVKWTKSKDW